VSATIEDYEKYLEEAVREREEYNGLHGLACIEIERLRTALSQAEIALDVAALLLGGYLPRSSYTPIEEARAAAVAALEPLDV
jgi:hypothetical protein